MTDETWDEIRSALVGVVSGSYEVRKEKAQAAAHMIRSIAEAEIQKVREIGDASWEALAEDARALQAENQRLLKAMEAEALGGLREENRRYRERVEQLEDQRCEFCDNSISDVIGPEEGAPPELVGNFRHPWICGSCWSKAMDLGRRYRQALETIRDFPVEQGALAWMAEVPRIIEGALKPSEDQNA